VSGKLFNYVEKIENSRYIIIKEIVNAKGVNGFHGLGSVFWNLGGTYGHLLQHS
jgi:hypothetical protein